MRRFSWWMGVLVLMQAASVQQEIMGQIVSPEVHPDRRVTFRLKSAHASSVLVQGIAGLDAQPMTKGEEDVWEVTVGPLEPELYSYVFSVDGTIVTDPQNRQVKKWLSLNSMFLVPGDPPLLHEQQPVPHGVVHHHIYDSKATESQRGVYIYTPPGYQARAAQEYPLLVLMHGYGDDASAWIEVGRANFILDNLIAQSKVKPMVVAMPYGHPLPIELRTAFDNYADRNMVLMQRDVLQDLIPFVAQNYRLKKGREYRGIVGLSMGGGQSLTIGLHNLDEFAWIGGFSSAAPQGALQEQYADLLADVAATNVRVKLLWIGCGKDDFLLQRNRTFIEWLKQNGIEHTYHESEGGHAWEVWRRYLATFLPMLFQE